MPNTVCKPAFTTSNLQLILHPQAAQSEAEENYNGHLEKWTNNTTVAQTITKTMKNKLRLQRTDLKIKILIISEET